MSTPLNRHYNLRSNPHTEEPSSEESGDEEIPSSLDSSLGLSQHSGAEDTSDTEADTMAYNITMPQFYGNPGDRADDWLTTYNNYAKATNLNDERKQYSFQFHLRGHAETWFRSLDAATRQDYNQVINLFKARFNGSDGLPPDMVILTVQQKPNEKVSDYFSRIMDITSHKGYPEAMVSSIAIKGLLVDIRNLVMPQPITSLEGARQAAILAERTVDVAKSEARSVASIDYDTFTQKVSEQVIAVLTTKFGNMFAEKQHTSQHQMPQGPNTQGYARNKHRRHHNPQNQPAQPAQGQAQQASGCTRCGGRDYHSLPNCSAYGVQCSYCKGRNHFTETCYVKRRAEANQ